jgi:AraC family transcriptional regulator
LSLSALDLKNTNKRIIDVAVEYGFESQESYIRAFNQMFGVTPGEYRKTDKSIILFNKLILPERKEILMQPEIITRKLLLESIMDLSVLRYSPGVTPNI